MKKEIKNIGAPGPLETRKEDPPQQTEIDYLARIAEALEGIQKDLNAIWAEHTAKPGPSMNPQG